MAGIRSEPAIPSHKHGSEFFGQRDVGRIIGGEIVTRSQIQDSRTSCRCRVIGDPVDPRLLARPESGHNSLCNQTAQYLRYFGSRRAAHTGSRCANRCDSQQTAGRCLQKPVHSGRRIEHDHRASRSSRSKRAESSSARTGCVYASARNSAGVAFRRLSDSGQQIIRKRDTGHGGASFQLMQGVGTLRS
jgi:hypothetical protein